MFLFYFRSKYQGFHQLSHCDSAKVIKLVENALSVISCKPNAIESRENAIELSSVLEKIHCSAIETMIALFKWYNFLLLFNLKTVLTIKIVEH